MTDLVCPRCMSGYSPRPIVDPKHPGRLLTGYAYAPDHSEYRGQLVCATCYVVLDHTPAVARGPSEIKVDVTKGTHHDF